MEKVGHSKGRGFKFSFYTDVSNKFITLDTFAAPHRCEDSQCPGDINRRKLEAAEEMAKAIAENHSPVCAFCGGFYPDAHTGTWPRPKCSCRQAGCNLPTALSAWEKAGKGEG